MTPQQTARVLRAMIKANDNNRHWPLNRDEIRKILLAGILECNLINEGKPE